MSFTESVRTCFDKMFTIDGRASRSEFWYFTLFVWIVSVALGFIFKDGGMIVRIVSIILQITTVTVTIRRLHDIGKSGYWALLELVPVVGIIIVLILCAKDSMPGRNQYGENPKGVY